MGVETGRGGSRYCSEDIIYERKNFRKRVSPPIDSSILMLTLSRKCIKLVKKKKNYNKGELNKHIDKKMPK